MSENQFFTQNNIRYGQPLIANKKYSQIQLFFFLLIQFIQNHQYHLRR